MSAPLLMVGSTLLFALMSVCVKLAAAECSLGEIVFFRSIVGVIALIVAARWRGLSLRTAVPGMHLWRSVVGVSALSLWFYAIAHLPLATAITLNYMSSVWMALFLIGGAVLTGATRVDPRLVCTVLLGFAGVALVLRPTLGQDQLGPGLVGLASGMLAALAYLQVTTLGRVGEPEMRVVFYFSLGGSVAGAVMTLVDGGFHAHSPRILLILVACGLLATTAQTLMTRAYAIGRTLSNASLQYLGIVFSTVFGLLIFHDPLTHTALAGTGLIIVAGLGATFLRSRVLPVHPADSRFPPSEN